MASRLTLPRTAEQTDRLEARKERKRIKTRIQELKVSDDKLAGAGFNTLTQAQKIDSLRDCLRDTNRALMAILRMLQDQ